jgi:hypothetical protein
MDRKVVVGGHQYHLFPHMVGKWCGDWKFLDTSKKEGPSSSYIGVARISCEDGCWKLKDTYTYPNGQTIVYHAKWVPCADGRVKVEETTDPGLQNFEIYGQELSPDAAVFRYTAPNGTMGMLETITYLANKNRRARTIQFFDVKTGDFQGAIVVNEEKEMSAENNSQQQAQ